MDYIPGKQDEKKLAARLISKTNCNFAFSKIN